jgi:uroporphyrinogen-III decarboxylase
MDRYRRPEKILAAAERFVPLQIAAAVRQTAAADSPLVFIPLHKGADGFMSDADYREFYWPTLKAVLKGLIAEGIVPVLFAEGGYAERLPVIADDDLPCGSVMWWFDATDMKAAKRALGGYACIGGNVPGDLLALGTETQVEQYVTGLLDDVAGDGGFVLSSGAVIDDASPETLSAMLETARAWRG